MRDWPKTQGQIVLFAVEPTLGQHHSPYPRRDYTETIHVSRGARAKRRSVNLVTTSSPGPANHPLGGASLPWSNGRRRPADAAAAEKLAGGVIPPFDQRSKLKFSHLPFVIRAGHKAISSISLSMSLALTPPPRTRLETVQPWWSPNSTSNYREGIIAVSAGSWLGLLQDRKLFPQHPSDPVEPRRRRIAIAFAPRRR